MSFIQAGLKLQGAHVFVANVHGICFMQSTKKNAHISLFISCLYLGRARRAQNRKRRNPIK